MPSLGADMEAGTLVEWLKRPGDRVKRGDIVAVVETQKGAIEIDIFEDGVIERWLVEPGTTVPVGTPLALIGGAQPAAAVQVLEIAASSGGARAGSATASGPATRSAAASNQSPGRAARVHHPPRAGWRAERGIALDPLSGSGPSGAILYADVERAAAAAASGPARRSASTSQRCAARSPRRWRARSGRSRIII